MFRLGYPEAVFDAVMDACALKAGDLILEIGPGTGKATRGLAERGLKINGIEPGAELIRLAKKNLVGIPSVTFVNQPFEDWHPDGADYRAIVAAQALHWVPAATVAQIAPRILPAGGSISAFGNVRALPPEPFNHTIQDIYAKLAPTLGGAPPEDWYLPRGKAEDYINATNVFGPIRHAAIGWSHRFTADSYVGLLNTISSHQMLAGDVLDAVLTQIHEAINSLGGSFELDYYTHIYTADLAVSGR